MLAKNHRTKEVNIFLKRLAFLIKSSITIPEALNILYKDTADLKLKKILLKLKNELEAGKSLSQACAGFPRYFPDFCQKIISLGERVGKLDTTLLKYTYFIDKKLIFAKKMFSLLLYPAIVIIIFFISLIFLLNFVFPQITAIFAENETALPAITILVINILAFLKAYGLIIVLLLIIAGCLLTKYYRLSEKKPALDKALLGVPGLKNIILKFELLNFCSSLELAMSSGYNFLEGLNLSQKLIKNSYLGEMFKRLIFKAREGKSIEESLEKEHLLPSFFVSIIKSSFKDGQLDDSLKYITETYEKELEIEIETIVQIIEPAAIILLGTLIGIVVISVLLPLLNLG